MRAVLYGLLIGLFFLQTAAKADESQDTRLGAKLLNILMNAHGSYERISYRDRLVIQECAEKLTTLGLFAGMLSSDLLQKFPVFSKVKSLELAGTIQESVLQKIPRCFPNVENFMCTYTAPLREDSIKFLAPLSRLRTLTLTDLASKNPTTFCVTDKTCELIAKQFPILKELAIQLALSHKNPITDRGILALAPLQLLEKLTLEPTDISDSALATIVASFPDLIVLSLTQDPNITDEGVLQLLRLKKLQTLNLTGCTKLTAKSREAFNMKKVG